MVGCEAYVDVPIKRVDVLSQKSFKSFAELTFGLKGICNTKIFLDRVSVFNWSNFSPA